MNFDDLTLAYCFVLVIAHGFFMLLMLVDCARRNLLESRVEVYSPEVWGIVQKAAVAHAVSVILGAGYSFALTQLYSELPSSVMVLPAVILFSVSIAALLIVLVFASLEYFDIPAKRYLQFFGRLCLFSFCFAFAIAICSDESGAESAYVMVPFAVAITTTLMGLVLTYAGVAVLSFREKTPA